MTARKNTGICARSPPVFGILRRTLWMVGPRGHKMCCQEVNAVDPIIFSRPMRLTRIMGAWCCILLFAGVHAMQLEHVLLHHLSGDHHATACLHHGHHHDVDAIAGLAADPHLPGITGDETCAVCDWTAVPACSPPLLSLAEEAGAWWVRAVLGTCSDGWHEVAIGMGIGWRGPPGTDIV